METAPAKSHQLLHNFSLPQLKWGHKSHHTSSSFNHRFRRCDSPSPELHHNLSPSPSRSDDGGRETENNNNAVKTGRRTARNNHRRFHFSPCSNQQQVSVNINDAVLVKKEKRNDTVSESEKEKDTCEGGKVKPWNLRPRRVVRFSTETMSYEDVDRGSERNRSTATNNHESSRSMRLRGGGGEGYGPGSGMGSMGFERKAVEKRKLWISLSREEIEEDVYSLTGSRPSRRPMKRPKNVQKQLDNVFPGLYLVGATVDSYRVHDFLK